MRRSIDVEVDMQEKNVGWILRELAGIGRQRHEMSMGWTWIQRINRQQSQKQPLHSPMGRSNVRRKGTRRFMCLNRSRGLRLKVSLCLFQVYRLGLGKRSLHPVPIVFRVNRTLSHSNGRAYSSLRTHWRW